MMRWLLALLIVVCTSLPASLSAHALDPGYLDLVSIGQDRWRVFWRAPDVSGRPMPIEARLPENCSFDAPPPSVFDGRAWTTGWVATCPGGLEGRVIEIAGLDQTRTDTLVRYELQPGKTQVHRLTSAETAFTVPVNPGLVEIVSSYVGLGITHILEGVDHLLFVFALLLLIRNRARLLWAITAFTIAHSITLAAASLGWLNIPPPPVEAVIALSIVFLAYELSLPPHARDPVAERFPWVVSFAFGLIHGLGFAGALREIGLPDGDIPLALFAFNVGVEIGQILFILLVLAAGATARRLYPQISAQTATLTRVATYGIGSLGAFWVIDRIAGF
ncbi:HupE/UreJ family protein [Ruegeria marina]|uniref:Hydrogenase/urease accessory protein HupE n=1 Tax=Ruegeria marina TaxID=639004 RepID=A0A1G7DJ07_9RHOB|nr:HupE/UreJ family protein [Ruegeria marina]SDE51046.1 Hydrogenase/urease accessory protein HupE [Ruegeria marina]